MSWSLLDSFKILIPILVVILGWLFNEHSKMKWERYKRKEDRYTALLDSLRGFYASPDSDDANEKREKKDEFIRQLNLCWLYCPDSVIRSGYKFLDQVTVGNQKSDEEKEEALGALLLLARKDLLAERAWLWFRKPTTLTPSDFRHITGT